jgi:hypothetical protein
MKNMLTMVCCAAALIGCKGDDKIEVTSASASASAEVVPTTTASATAEATVVPTASASAAPAVSAVPSDKK